MRPVERGPHPTDALGAPVRFSQYAQARSALIDRLGEYCSYCEMHLDASLAVEHIQPKAVSPHLTLAWDNFLLACTNCNATKGDTNVKLADYLWPDRDDTFHALRYGPGGQVRSASGPKKPQADKLIAWWAWTKCPIPAKPQIGAG